MRRDEVRKIIFQGSCPIRGVVLLSGVWPIRSPFQFEMHDFIFSPATHSFSFFTFSDLSWIKQLPLHSVLLSYFTFKIFPFAFSANRIKHIFKTHTTSNPKSRKPCKLGRDI